MANKNLFQSYGQPAYNRGPATNAINAAGGKAFVGSDEQVLAQLSLTGTLGNAFYSSATAQLDKILHLAHRVSAPFLAKTAVYARQKGYMKDVPALLVAKLATRDTELLKSVFSRVCNNAKMVRNFVQIIRSGKVGRRSFGSAPKKLIQYFLNGLSDNALLNASVGESPSLVDIIKLVHPKPNDDVRRAFYGYLLDKEIDKEKLPSVVQHFENWKKGVTGEPPEVDFRLLTAFALTEMQWRKLAETASWHTVRQGLNMFKRHGAFDNKETLAAVAAKLSDPEQIRRAKVFPYQLLTTCLNIDPTMPSEIRRAVEIALEVSIQNIPSYEGQVYVFNDVSGSMHDPITGSRGSATSKTRCIDVAALIAASIKRKNPSAIVMPFDTQVKHIDLNFTDTVINNAKKLAQFPGGGTNCGVTLEELNRNNAKGDLCIYVSDNESWFRDERYYSSSMMGEWTRFKDRNPKAKLVCIDLTANGTTQAQEATDVLNIAGFSDQVFNVINLFVNDQLLGNHLVDEIEKISV